MTTSSSHSSANSNSVKTMNPQKKKAKTKKPSSQQIPPPPPGWEIVGKDDPRLDCLPGALMSYFPGSKEWLTVGFAQGDKVPENIRAVYHYVLPIAQSPPPMIRLRLPSEKPTREDANKDGHIFIICPSISGRIEVITWTWDEPFDGDELAWFSLPEGVLPCEPSQEEKWRKEFDEEWERSLKGRFLHVKPQEMAWQGFLAAKKGGAE